MRSIARRGIQVSIALLPVAGCAGYAGCAGDGGHEGDLAEGPQPARRPTTEVVARLPRPPARPGMLVPIARFQGSYDAETNQLSFQPVEPSGRAARAPSFGPTLVGGMQISTINSVYSTSSTTGAPYVGEGGATRTCRLPSTNTCQASTGGATDQPCLASVCASLKLNEILGLTWSEVWVQIDSINKGAVISGDNRALLSATNWRVTEGGMLSAATSPGVSGGGGGAARRRQRPAASPAALQPQLQAARAPSQALIQALSQALSRALSLPRLRARARAPPALLFRAAPPCPAL